ncbi:MAG: NAD-dependent succinate-semialdehyde dehydrogenase [Alphaproteobacteria bacterium]
MKLSNTDLFQTKAYINGQWQDTAESYDVLNPADTSLLAKVSFCGAKEANAAINAAQQALADWQGYTANQRGQILRRWAELMLENQEDLARIMVYEQGKPFAEAKGEVAYAASFLTWYAEEARRVNGDIIPPFAPDKRLMVFKQPIGVVAAITPWNFPLAMITRKVAPALAVGCTAIVKPSEETPLSANALAVLGEKAGLPKGVFNIISGDAPAIGDAIMQSHIVRKVSFTGSTKTGKILMAKAADTVKKLSLELGGNAPFIVFEDADIDAAVEGAIAAKYRNTGQTCICVNRFYIHDAIYDEFIVKFRSKVAQLKVGQGFDDNVVQGPLINKAALDKVERLVGDALSQGAHLIVGGQKSDLGVQYYEPTILGDISPDMPIVNEEIFGPVSACMRFSDDTEVIRMANDTNAGLAAYFYTKNIRRLWRISEGLEYGLVGINTGLISTEVAPFGGMKESGIGREGASYGIDEYLEVKYICLGDV